MALLSETGCPGTPLCTLRSNIWRKIPGPLLSGSCAVTVFSPTSILRLTERSFAAGGDISEIHRSMHDLAGDGQGAFARFSWPGFLPTVRRHSGHRGTGPFRGGGQQPIVCIGTASGLAIYRLCGGHGCTWCGLVSETLAARCCHWSRTNFGTARRFVRFGCDGVWHLAKVGRGPRRAHLQRMRDETYVWRAFHWTIPKKPMPGMGTTRFQLNFRSWNSEQVLSQ